MDFHFRCFKNNIYCYSVRCCELLSFFLRGGRSQPPVSQAVFFLEVVESSFSTMFPGNSQPIVCDETELSDSSSSLEWNRDDLTIVGNEFEDDDDEDNDEDSDDDDDDAEYDNGGLSFLQPTSTPVTQGFYVPTYYQHGGYQTSFVATSRPAPTITFTTPTQIYTTSQLMTTGHDINHFHYTLRPSAAHVSPNTTVASLPPPLYRKDCSWIAGPSLRPPTHSFVHRQIWDHYARNLENTIRSALDLVDPDDML